MSVSEKKLADFILSNSGLIRDYSSQHLAGSVGVSQSSVVKFSQKLGYRGFTDLKLAIHESVVKQSSNATISGAEDGDGKECASVAQALLRARSEVLLSTSELNDEKSLLQAVAALDNKKRIQVLGSSEAGLIAKDFSQKLLTLGKSAFSDSDPYLQLAGLSTLNKSDLVFLISSDGRSRLMMHMAKQAKQAGALLISLTSFSANPLSALAQIKLYCVSQNGMPGFPQVHTSASQQYVVDVLCTMLVKGKTSVTRSRKAIEFLNDN